MSRLIGNKAFWLLTIAQLTMSSLFYGQYPVSEFKNEKVLIRSDRSTYVSGEIIWYNLSVIWAESGVKSPLSKVVYFEILDHQNIPIHQQILTLKNASVASDFYIPINTPTGKYQLVAYTRWMKNGSEKNFYRKPITIINTQSKGNLQIDGPVNSELSIHYFPEGGKTVVGRKASIAVKLLNSYDLGVVYKGILIGPENDTISTFQSDGWGIGKVEFIPDTTSGYRIELAHANGQISGDLPSSEVFGESFHLIEKENGLLIYLLKSDSAKRDFRVEVEGVSGESVSHFKYSDRNDSAWVEIGTETLSSGVNKFEVFTGKQFIGRRLYFMAPDISCKLETRISKNEFGTRSLVNCEIVNTGTENIQLSVSVFKADSIGDITSNLILSNKILESLVKGKIETPYLYFDSNDKKNRDTDNLMLTLQWDDKINSGVNEPTILPEYEGIILNGKVRGEFPNMTGVNAYLSVPGKNFRLYRSKISPEGEFQFITDSKLSDELIFTIPEIPDTNYFVSLHSPFYNHSIDYFGNDTLVAISKSTLKNLEARNISMQVQNIYQQKQINQFETVATDTIKFYGLPGRTFLLDDYTRFPTMQEVITEYVQGVGVRGKKDNLRFRIFSDQEGGSFEREPLVLLDGIPMGNNNHTLQLNPLKIEKLEIVRDRVVFGDTYLSGVLSFTSYDEDLSFAKGFLNFKKVSIDGIRNTRKFNHADHSNDSLNQRIPDFRTLLYWNPDMEINQKTSQISFYTSDIIGKFIGIIEGVGEHGTPYFTTFEFEVLPTQVD